MSGRTTKRVKNSTSATLQKLEDEAKEFTQKSVKKTDPNTEKPLTARQHLAGLVLTGLLARSQGLISQGDLIKEAYSWADRMLDISE